MQPLVFVHGTRTSSAIWVEQQRAMAAVGHATHALDLPGHGARAGERFTLEGALRAIDDAVARIGAPPLLVGLSLGGYCTLAYAARRPGLVAGVVLAGCSTQLKGKPLTTYGHVTARADRILGFGAGSWHVVTDMLESLSGYSPLRDLTRLTVPVWLVNGRRDPLRLDERRCLAAAPQARLTVVPRAGHDVNSDAPVAFNRVLLDAVEHLRAA